MSIIAILCEDTQNEPRVSATPDVVKRYLKLGYKVQICKGAGTNSGYIDDAFTQAGASVCATNDATLKGASIVLCVRRPDENTLKKIAKDSILIGQLNPYDAPEKLLESAQKGHISALSMELVPRITRAQSMDVLSSQANLAGYRAVLEATSIFGKAMPMMMTAAGTVPAAKVFVMGAGVAGLQAIATARRLGAIVSATDVRPAAKEQVASLGAKFVAVENEEFKQAETAGGYAKEMSAEYKSAQAELVAKHISEQDIVITTALIPGRPAPQLLTKAMVESMKPGSVIVDMGIERGGNCALTHPNTIINHNGVYIIGLYNLPGRLASSASQLYSRNLFAFIEALIEKTDNGIALKQEDDIIKATLLTHNGENVHQHFGGKPA